MNDRMNEFKDEIDWHVLKQQQNPVSNEKVKVGEYDYKQDRPLGVSRKPPEIVNTFLGQMPREPNVLHNKELMNEMISGFAGAPGMQIAQKGIPLAKELGKKGIEYLQPGKASEEFRKTLGTGTSKENIKELGERVKFAKGSAQEEALIPKRELYKQEGKSDVYNIGKEHLPEGNLPKMAEMIEPGVNFTEGQSKALSNALKDYRKTGNVDSFLRKSEDIFNIADLPEKAAAKIEDSLFIPIKRESKYFEEKNVTEYYDRGIKKLHEEYKNKPTLNNYDKLQSKIKKETRKLSAKGKNLDTPGEEKLEALKTNIKNLNSDKESFMQTLPEKMKNLENEFRDKYAKGVGKYEDAPKTMKKLASGKASEVSSAQVAKLFTNPTKETLEILKDLGPSAGKNILYNALQKVPVNDAEGLANTIKDLKRTKGYDQFIDHDMEMWANNMLKHTRNASLIVKGLQGAGGAMLGASVFGPVGGVIGASAPFLGKGAKYLAEKLRK